MSKKYQLKQFNLLCESIEHNLILEAKKQSLYTFFSQRWGLDNEIDILLPFITTKLNRTFGNFYSNDIPGEPGLDENSEINPIDQGTDNPGFEISWDLTDEYVKQNLFPILLENKRSKIYKLNQQYHFAEKNTNINAKLIIKLNAHGNDETDLSKPDVQIKKLSITKWDGKVYLNFECDGVDREKSNISIGTITVNVKVPEYKSLIEKLGNFMEGLSNRSGTGIIELFDTVSKGIDNIFNKTKKQKPTDELGKIKRRGELTGNIPEADVKCTITFDKDLKKDTELGGRTDRWDYDFDDDDKTEWDPDFIYTDVVKDTDKIEEIMPLINFEKLALKFFKANDTNIAYELTDDQTWTPAKRNGQFYSTELNKSVTNKTNGYVCCSFVSQLKQFSKNYYVYLDIDNWKAASFDNNFLIKKNPEPIYIQVDVIDNNTDNLVLERWYNIENFKKAEPEALRFILKSFQHIKPLS